MREIVSFYLSGRKYGVRMSHMEGFENYREMVQQPDMPDFLEGVIDVRGELIPVVDIRKFLILPAVSVSGDTKYVILRTIKGKLAFMTDRVSEVLRIEDAYVMGVPALMQTGDIGYIDFVAKSGTDLILAINPERLLGAEDWKAVNEIKDKMEAQDD